MSRTKKPKELNLSHEALEALRRVGRSRGLLRKDKPANDPDAVNLSAVVEHLAISAAADLVDGPTLHALAKSDPARVRARILGALATVEPAGNATKARVLLEASEKDWRLAVAAIPMLGDEIANLYPARRAVQRKQ
jgi:hypothetical protein